MYILPDSLRTALAEPAGKLFSPSESSAEEQVCKFRNLPENRDALLIAVGDVVAHTLNTVGCCPDIIIIDYKTLRSQIRESTFPNVQITKVENPAASITQEAWNGIKTSILKFVDRNERQLIHVNGEEDLLVFPAVLEAPLGTFICYGQPHQGIVVIKVAAQTQTRFKKILEQFNWREKNGA